MQFIQCCTIYSVPPRHQISPTLRLVQKELYTKVANKWEDIGIQLGIDDGLLDTVKKDNHGDSACSLLERNDEDLAQESRPSAIMDGLSGCLDMPGRGKTSSSTKGQILCVEISIW